MAATILITGNSPEEEKKKAKLYDAMALLRDNKNYLKLSKKVDAELMEKMWCISHNKPLKYWYE